MKKFNQFQLIAFCLLLMVVASCAPKYGAHFNQSGSYYTADAEEPVANKGQHEENAPPIEVKKMEAADGEASGKYAIVSKDRIIPVVPNPSVERLVKKHEENVRKIESSGLESSEMKKKLKKEKKRARKEIKKEVKKEIKEIRKSSETASDSYILMMILAVLLPPLAVGLVYGIVDKFWISLLLTLLFWLPGAIYALIVVNDYYK